MIGFGLTSNPVNISLGGQKKLVAYFGQWSFARHIELTMAAILSHKPWSPKNNFFKTWVCCWKFCADLESYENDGSKMYW